MVFSTGLGACLYISSIISKSWRIESYWRIVVIDCGIEWFVWLVELKIVSLRRFCNPFRGDGDSSRGTELEIFDAALRERIMFLIRFKRGFVFLLVNQKINSNSDLEHNKYCWIINCAKHINWDCNRRNCIELSEMGCGSILGRTEEENRRGLIALSGLRTFLS